MNPLVGERIQMKYTFDELLSSIERMDYCLGQLSKCNIYNENGMGMKDDIKRELLLN